MTDGVADDLNVELVEVLGGEAVAEVRSCENDGDNGQLSGPLALTTLDSSPRGVSTRTVVYSSSTLVATHSAGIVSNVPRGWHRSRRS
jgi:hypothetical protein